MLSQPTDALVSPWLPSEDEGQVVPALILAVVAALACAVLLFTVGEAADQSSRTETAADAAALAVGEAFVDFAEGEVVGVGSGPSFVRLTHISSLGRDFVASGEADRAASDYARANGSQVVGMVEMTVDDHGEWVFQVETRSIDVVQGSGGVSAQSSARSRVRVTMNGLCAGGNGVLAMGGCLTPGHLNILCNEHGPDLQPTATPTATPVDGSAPVEPPAPDPHSALPPWLRGQDCPAAEELLDALAPEVVLTI